MEFLITIAIFYGLGITLILLLNAFLAGYNNTEPTKFDLLEALVWPLTIVTFFGILTKALVKTIQSKIKG